VLSHVQRIAARALVQHARQRGRRLAQEAMTAASVRRSRRPPHAWWTCLHHTSSRPLVAAHAGVLCSVCVK
jgi:hypothetical protein